MKLFLVLALVVAFAWGAVLPQREAGGQSCMLCEFVIQTAEGYLSSNASEQEIIKFLEQACGLVPAPYSDEVRLPLALGPILPSRPSAASCSRRMARTSLSGSSRKKTPRYDRLISISLRALAILIRGDPPDLPSFTCPLRTSPSFHFFY